MDLNTPIKEIYTKKVLSLTPDQNLLDAANLFDLKHIHHIPITDDGKLVGFLSKSDFLLFRNIVDKAGVDAEMDRLKNKSMADYTGYSLINLAPTATIKDALDIFSQNFIHAIPIVDDDKLVGIVSTLDIIKALM